MKLKYLGTAAAEGMPAVFCNCDYCRKARELGGKNIRTRSQSIINDDLLIDLPADTYFHFLQNGIEGDKIKYLLVTHSHQDHFYINELLMRKAPYGHNMRCEKLKIFCGRGVFDKLSADDKLANIEFTKLNHFEEISFGDYSVIAMPARHYFGDDALIYIIKNGDKTILYAHDTGYLYEENFDFIEKNNIVFDMVSFDCTNVILPVSDEGGHMGIQNIPRVIERLESMNAITSNTIRYVNHFSHNGNPLHDEIQKIAKGIGCLASYDGCEVEI